jgi:hypothetical protein
VFFVARSKTEDKEAPSKSLRLQEGFSVSEMKKSVKQRRASILGTADEGGFAFTIVVTDDQSRNIGLKVRVIFIIK